MTDIETLIATADRLKLAGREILHNHLLEDIAAVYNGIGSDSMPNVVVSGLTRHFSEWEAAALIHDCQFVWCEDRSDDSFHVVNADFAANCRKLSDDRYCWYHPMRYVRRWDAGQAGALLDDYAMSAWAAAYGVAHCGE